MPSSLKSGALSILAKGLLGLGSQGVPSTRDQGPMVELHPIMLGEIRAKVLEKKMRYKIRRNTKVI